MCFGGFNLAGASTGGLAGPASVLHHPNFTNLVGGGAFTDAVKKKTASDSTATSDSSSKTLLSAPQQQQAKTTAEQPGKNPLALDTPQTIQ